MSVTFALPESSVDELRAALALDDETGWTCVAQSALDGRVLLGRELIPVPEGAYLERGPRRLRISSSGFMPAFTRAAADPQAVPVFIHTHPGMAPAPSELDDVVDEELRALALSRTGRPDYVSVIFGGTAGRPRVRGRVWGGGDSPDRLDRLRAAGPRVGVLLADGAADGEPPAIFDRHLSVFGPAGQTLLGALTIGVIGAGGTGSPTIEMLARLGVGKLIIVDHDTVEDTNLTRIHETVVGDVGRLKVAVAKERAEAYGTGTEVEAIGRKALDAEVIGKLATCDVVFGCTDDHAGRLVLSKLAYHYLVPVFDCGVQISVEDGQVSGIDSRVTIVAPGTPCLVCRGQADTAIAGAEMMDPAERAELAAEGYVPGLGEDAPAVVAYTTSTSAWAVSELLRRLFGIGPSDLPAQLAISFHDPDVSWRGRPARADHYCTDPSKWARGDTEPPLDMPGIL